jgi:ligand-binding sensor domain-containing protein
VFTNLWRQEEWSTPLPFLAHFPRRLAVTGDRLWLTGPGVGLIRFEGTNQLRFGPQQGLIAEDTGTVATAPDGTVWLDVGRHGVASFDGTQFSYLTRRDGLPAGWITSMHVTPDGSAVWFATPEQLLACFDGRSFTHYGSSDDLAGQQNSYAGRGCFDIESGPDGAVWFSAANGGLWRYEANAFKHYTSADGLPAGAASHLQSTPSGALWAGVGTNRVRWFDGRGFKTTTEPASVTDRVPGPDGLTWARLAAPSTGPAGSSGCVAKRSSQS